MAVIPVRKLSARASLEARQIHYFMHHRHTDGAALDISPYFVDHSKGLRFRISGKRIWFSGYRDFDGLWLPGRIAIQGREKRIYFWEDEAARKRGERPIVPEGHLVAGRRKNSGKGVWKVNYRHAQHSPHLEGRLGIYGQYLLKDRGERIHYGHWLVEHIRRLSARKEIESELLRLPLPTRSRRTAIFTVTHELEARVKLTEFWTTRGRFEKREPPFAARAGGVVAPIIPAGHVFAQQARGKWEIPWKRKPEAGETIKQTLEYGSFLRAKTGARVRKIGWKVYSWKNKRDGGMTRQAEKMVMRQHLKLTVPADFKGDEIYSEAIEVGGRFKMVSFWADKASKARGKLPFDVRFITVRPNNHGPQENGIPARVFWAKFSDVDKFEELIEEGVITRDQLFEFLSCRYMEKHYEARAFNLIRKLGGDEADAA